MQGKCSAQGTSLAVTDGGSLFFRYSEFQFVHRVERAGIRAGQVGEPQGRCMVRTRFVADAATCERSGAAVVVGPPWEYRRKNKRCPARPKSLAH